MLKEAQRGACCGPAFCARGMALPAAWGAVFTVSNSVCFLMLPQYNSSAHAYGAPHRTASPETVLVRQRDSTGAPGDLQVGPGGRLACHAPPHAPWVAPQEQAAPFRCRACKHGCFKSNRLLPGLRTSI